MKKIAFATLALILLMSTFAFYSATNKPRSAEALQVAMPTLFIDPANVTNTALVPGTNFTVALKLSNITGLYGYQYTLTWNDSIINYVSIHDNVPLPPGYFLAQNTTTGAEMDFVVTSTSAGYNGATGNFVLRTIVFKALATGSTIIAITNDVLGDPSAQSIPHNTLNGFFSNAPIVPSKFQLTISANGNGVTNPAAGKYLYTKGTQVSVNATPNGGFAFDHWMLDNTNSGSSNPFTVTMNANHTLEAFFAAITPTKFQLTISVNGNGTTNPAAGKYLYTKGTQVSVNATPNSGFIFDHWMLDIANNGSSNTLIVNMNANHTLEAFFVPQQVAMSTLFIDPANVTNTALVPGTNFTVALKLSNVTGLYGYQYKLTWNDSIINYVSIHDNVPLPPGYFLATNTTTGAEMDFVVTSTSAGYGGATGNFVLRTIVFKVLGTGSSVIAITNDVLGDPSAKSIPHNTFNGFFSNAGIAPIKFQLTINVIGNGTTTPTPGTYMIDAGTALNVTAIPDSGWLLQQWILDSQNKGVSNPFSLTMNANHTLTAEFKIRGPVIPEYWLGPILGLVGCFAALGLFKLSKRNPSKVVAIAQ